jgi:prohibitin 1
MKNIFKFLLLAVITVSFVSCGTTLEPGERAILFDSMGDGVDTSMVYKEGYHFHAPWKDMIVYNSRNQTKTYKSQVMDKNGTEITIVSSVNFAVEPNKIGQLHLKHGDEYDISFINPKAYGAIKDVAGRYTYEELYSKKREALETEIEAILKKDFKGNFLRVAFVEVADVNLPNEIAAEIKRKETQKQRNLTSKLKEEENHNLAQAKIAEAEGNKQSAILNSEAEAEKIRIKNEALRQSPKYIELMNAEAVQMMAQGINRHGLGNNNVFGSDTFIMKNLK